MQVDHLLRDRAAGAGRRSRQVRPGVVCGARGTSVDVGQLDDGPFVAGPLGDVAAGEQQVEVADDLPDDQQRLLGDGARPTRGGGRSRTRCSGRPAGSPRSARSAAGGRARRASTSAAWSVTGSPWPRQQPVERHLRRAPEAVEVAHARARAPVLARSGACDLGVRGDPRPGGGRRRTRARRGRRRTACRSCCAPAGRTTRRLRPPARMRSPSASRTVGAEGLGATADEVPEALVVRRRPGPGRRGGASARARSDGRARTSAA